MKNLKKIILVLFVMLPFYFLGQPPNPTGDPNSDSNAQELGGNAPIGEGIFILFSLGVAYAGRKTYLLQKKRAEF